MNDDFSWSLAELNEASSKRFTHALADIFEHSTWVPQRASQARPFEGIEQLHRSMCAVVADAAPEEQLALIRAHPQLAGKAALRGELTAASTAEQAGAGLDQCSPDELARITELNDAYQARFGFPFILAVRGYTRAEVIANLAQRLDRSRDEEIAEALQQIERIALLRLRDLING